MGSKQDKRKLGYIGKVPGKRNGDTWFTPPRYIKMVNDILGVIELDPFSSATANEIVKATRFFDESDSAFEKDWRSKTVFMNPPYSNPLIRLAIDKFIEQLNKHNFEAIVLTNNATETRWFQKLLSCAKAVCFLNHRISFYNVDGKTSSGNTRGQVFFYYGDDKRKFVEVFSKEGVVL